MSPRLRSALVLLGLLVTPVSSPALTLLTAGKQATFSTVGKRGASAIVQVAGDRALEAPPDPTCPASSSLRFALSRRGADFEDLGEVSLPCEGWKRTRTGYRYASTEPAAPGGVREIVLGHGRLLVRASGLGYAYVAGPVAYVEAWLTLGDETYLVRLQNFRRNDAKRVVSRRASRLGAAGEAAFWDTL